MVCIHLMFACMVYLNDPLVIGKTFPDRLEKVEGCCVNTEAEEMRNRFST